MQAHVIDYGSLDTLIARLRELGYRTLGTAIESGALVYKEISAASDLAVGYADKQSPGHYRVSRGESKRAFDCVVGPKSLKNLFHQPVTTVFEVNRVNGQLNILKPDTASCKIAVIGARPCELAAMRIQDTVLGGGEFADARYSDRRKDAFIVAVNCTRPAGTCFCASMGTGPTATSGFDLSLTELELDGKIVYLARAGSEPGETLLNSIGAPVATQRELELEHSLLDEASRKMGLSLDTVGLKDALASAHDSAHWNETAARCMACGNCTSVCPTCFCTTVEDHGDIGQRQAKRVRKWTSCFTSEFSYLHGGHVRQSVVSRYRHWITHKLSSWHDQFGMSGCVGCGRCITWCPVGINIVEEAAAIAQSHKKSHPVDEEITK